MNKQEEHKQRNSLTLLVFMYIFFIIIITVLIAFASVRIMMSMNMVPRTAEGRLDLQYALQFMVAISLIVGLCITSWANKFVLKHINKFIDQMNRLALGDFKARLAVGKFLNKYPIVKEVTDSFNCMAEELENTEMLRGDFINNFSHEFKTPIVSIAGFAKLLKRGNLTEQQKNEYLDIIEEEALRLSSMATNVLNMTRVENQTILTDIITFNLSEQIRSSVLLLENRWTKKKIEFSLEFDEHIIRANEELLKQVWINLLDNAVKFSPEYGVIVIKIAELDGMYRIVVSNAGDEIPEESRHKIFNKFYQADESHSSEGNGIGLAIVKRVVELHEGNVSLECNNGITSFIVTLPKETR